MNEDFAREDRDKKTSDEKSVVNMNINWVHNNSQNRTKKERGGTFPLAIFFHIVNFNEFTEMGHISTRKIKSKSKWWKLWFQNSNLYRNKCHQIDDDRAFIVVSFFASRRNKQEFDLIFFKEERKKLISKVLIKSYFVPWRNLNALLTHLLDKC